MVINVGGFNTNKAATGANCGEAGDMRTGADTPNTKMPLNSSAKGAI